MNSTTLESPARFFRIYIRTLSVLNVCLAIAAVLFPVAGVVFFVTSYVFNDSGSVPQTVAPLVRFLFLDTFFAIILLFWQIKIRKHLFTMLPAARKSMVNLGVAYVVVALVNLFQFYLVSFPLAAIGIWWIVVFTRNSTKAAFENSLAAAEPLPPAS